MGTTGLVVIACSVPSVAGASTKSPLAQGLAFYKGQTLTLIAPTTTGSQFDTEVRVIAPLMATYLHATVNIEDAGSSVGGANTLVAENPDGLTFGYVSPTAALTETLYKTAGYNFNPERLPFLGGPIGTPQMIIGYKGSQYKDFQELRTATAADPIKWIGSNSTGGNLTGSLFADAFGLNVNFINAYSGTPALLEGLLRGDGDIATEPQQTAGPVVKAGQAYAIELDSVPNRQDVNYSALKSVPTLADLAKKYPPKTDREKTALHDLQSWQTITNIEFVAPARVSADKVTALRAAMQYAMTSKTLHDAFLADGNPIGSVSGAAAKASLVKAETIIKSVENLIGTSG